MTKYVLNVIFHVISVVSQERRKKKKLQNEKHTQIKQKLRFVSNFQK